MAVVVVFAEVVLERVSVEPVVGLSYWIRRARVKVDLANLAKSQPTIGAAKINHDMVLLRCGVQPWPVSLQLRG